MELPPMEVVLKLLLLQTGVGLLLFLLVRQVLAWKGRKHFPPLTGGSVLLTGTSSGIGRTAAVYLAQRGFKVLAGVRKESDAQALREIGLSGIHPVIIDVAKPDSVQACHAHVLSLLSAKTIPPLVAVINNAGLLQDATVEFHDMATMRHMFDVNYFGLVTVSSVFLPLLRGASSSSPKGRLINIGSVAGKVSFPRYGAYAASKHAVEAITDTLRAELTPAGVSVSLIQPGFCRTELFVRGVAQPQQQQAAQSHAKNDTTVPKAAKEAYPFFYTQKFEKKNAGPMENGSDPVVVCQAMHHALTSAYPKTRYPVAKINRVEAMHHALTSAYPQTRYPVAKINRAEVAIVFLVRQLLPDRLFDKSFLLNC